MKPAIEEIRQHQRRRVFAMTMQRAIDSRLRSYVAIILLQTDDELRTQRDAADAAGKGIKGVLQSAHEKAAKLIGKLHPGRASKDANATLIDDELRPLVLTTEQSRAAWDSIRDGAEDQMRSLAESLPVFEWVKGIRGFAALGLSIIVAESGDLSGYANPSRLWKRLGLAPQSCYTMTTKSGDTANAIPRQRRSAIWTIGDSLIKGNRDGVYRKLYLDRKVYELARTDDGKPKSPMHAHRRAQRYMEKRLIKDLWRAWREAEGHGFNQAA
jgi:hypothetical protein